MKIGDDVKRLEKAFDVFNEILFNGELEDVGINFGRMRKGSSTLGMFYYDQDWCSFNDEDIKQHEIKIGNNQDLSSTRTYEVLLHEMMHLYGFQRNIRNCSGQYHNRNFKEIAIKHGMEYHFDKADKKYGWMEASVTKETAKLISTFEKIESFVENESYEPEKREVAKSYKYYCECGELIQSKNPELKAVCNSCNKEFVPLSSLKKLQGLSVE